MTKSLINGARQLPTHHVTVRVPWHDNGWNGTICRDPLGNTSCLILKRIANSKNDSVEIRCAGNEIATEPEHECPPCLDEHVTIFSPTSLTRAKRHPYIEKNPETHGHMADTPLLIPAFGAACVPFRWMLRDTAPERAQELDLGYAPEREPELAFTSGWVQEHDNQRVFLDTFFSAIEPEKSLCFFYAKRTPLSDSPRRVIVGVGRVTSVGLPTEYRYNTKQPPLRSSLWERNVHHSIRSGFDDGFLLPYQALIARAETDPAICLEDLVAFAPDEHFESFSYGTEHLTHDGAIAALLALHGALQRIAKVLDGPWVRLQGWVDHELNRLWKARGPFPGLGSALRAFGLPRGTLIAYEIASAQKGAPAFWRRLAAARERWAADIERVRALYMAGGASAMPRLQVTEDLLDALQVSGFFREVARLFDAPRVVNLLRRVGIDASNFPTVCTPTPKAWWEFVAGELRRGAVGEPQVVVRDLVHAALEDYPANPVLARAAELTR